MPEAGVSHGFERVLVQLKFVSKVHSRELLLTHRQRAVYDRWLQEGDAAQCKAKQRVLADFGPWVPLRKTEPEGYGHETYY